MQCVMIWCGCVGEPVGVALTENCMCLFVWLRADAENWWIQSINFTVWILDMIFSEGLICIVGLVCYSFIVNIKCHSNLMSITVTYFPHMLKYEDSSAVTVMVKSLFLSKQVAVEESGCTGSALKHVCRWEDCQITQARAKITRQTVCMWSQNVLKPFVSLWVCVSGCCVFLIRFYFSFLRTHSNNS